MLKLNQLENRSFDVQIAQNPQVGTVLLSSTIFYPEEKTNYRVNWRNETFRFDKLEMAVHFFNTPAKQIQQV